MKISDGKICAELITNKGRIYKFDDMHCMISYYKEKSNNKYSIFFIFYDFSENNILIPAENCFFVKGGEI